MSLETLNVSDHAMATRWLVANRGDPATVLRAEKAFRSAAAEGSQLGILLASRNWFAFVAEDYSVRWIIEPALRAFYLHPLKLLKVVDLQASRVDYGAAQPLVDTNG